MRARTREVVLALVAVLALPVMSAGRETTIIEPTRADLFLPVLPSVTAAPTERPQTVAEPRTAEMFAPPVSEPRRAVPQPTAQRNTVASGGDVAPTGAARVRGTATWYCVPGVSRCHHAYSGGMYAAAGAELRIGKWRGRKVTVCQGDQCVRVTLIDWCACAGDRVIDLYGDAFRRLAPLSAGRIRVTVRW